MKTRQSAPRTRSFSFGSAGLWLIAGLHTLAALSLIFVLGWISPAKAADDPSCGGKNIIEQLRKEDPRGFADVEKDTANLKNGESVFWKIEKAGLKPSYLLGTIHLSDPRVIKLPNEAARDFDAADAVIVESDEIADKNAASAKLMARPDLSMFTDSHTIYDFLTPDQKAMLEKQLSERGIPLAAVAKMKPWVLSTFVALPTCELTRKAAGADFLDEKLTKDAMAAGKKVVGLETLTEQLEAMASVSMKTHVSGLIGVLKDPQRTKDLMETMIELYASGRPAMIGPLSEYVGKMDADSADMAEFEKKMITVRNHHMADRAEATLDKGNAFMAVGALHLPGDEGLVSLLQQKGFTVTPVTVAVN
jgi:uncharacterized protein YbaP (TraB family)